LKPIPKPRNKTDNLHHPEDNKIKTLISAEQLVEPLRRERIFCAGDTAIKLYLREIAKVKVLTAQAEIE